MVCRFDHISSTAHRVGHRRAQLAQNGGTHGPGRQELGRSSRMHGRVVVTDRARNCISGVAKTTKTKVEISWDSRQGLPQGTIRGRWPLDSRCRSVEVKGTIPQWDPRSNVSLKFIDLTMIDPRWLVY